MATSRVAPLNTDQRMWALQELAKLDEESAALRQENEALKKENEALRQELENQGGTDEIPAKSYKPGEGDV